MSMPTRQVVNLRTMSEFMFERGDLSLGCQLRDAADTITDLRKALRREYDARMALQRDYNNQIKRIQNQRKQLREMQAALERKTCHMVTDRDAFDVWLECDECGCILPNPYSMPEIHYCPNCGRKVGKR